jgi:hypothetical protein
MRNRLLAGLIAALLLATPLPAHATKSPMPGDACTAPETGNFVTTAGSQTSPNGYLVICDGSHWNLFLGFDTTGKLSLNSISGAAAPVGTVAASVVVKTYFASGCTGTTGATYTTPANLLYATVEVVGGGGWREPDRGAVRQIQGHCHRGEPRALVTTVPRPPAVMALFRGRLQMPLSECGPALRRTRWGSGRGTAQPAAAPSPRSSG